MAQSDLFRELYCSVCLGLFSDPVSLNCDHIFCRSCIETCRSSMTPKCPECRAPLGSGAFKTNRALRNMADRLKAERYHCTCHKHQEKMKLFCETDRQLICVVCRDEQTHRGHSCVPIGEAATASKDELEKALEFVSKDNGALTHHLIQQNDEMRKIKERSSKMMDQIFDQFKKLHNFLRVREKELKKEVKEQEMTALAPMQEKLAAMTQALTPQLEKERMLRSGLDIMELDRFQQWWIDTGSPVVDELRAGGNGTGEQKTQNSGGKFKSEEARHHVILDSPRSLYLGPYESHLQFFVWKEMLRVIKPVPDRLTVEDSMDPLLRVSSDKSTVRHIDLASKKMLLFGKAADFSMSPTWSSMGFQSGQHYWEVTVGEKMHWSLGVDAEQDSSRKAICRLNGAFGKHRFKTQREIPLDLCVRPRTIGTYLDCERKCISFYNADNMTLIQSTVYDTNGSMFAYFNSGFYFKGENADPLCLCWY